MVQGNGPNCATLVIQSWPSQRGSTVFKFWIISWILLDPSRWYQLWNNNTCCLPYTANAMPGDALATLGARASAAIVLTPKVEYSVSSIRRVNFSHCFRTLGINTKITLIWKHKQFATHCPLILAHLPLGPHTLEFQLTDEWDITE